MKERWRAWRCARLGHPFLLTDRTYRGTVLPLRQWYYATCRCGKVTTAAAGPFRLEEFWEEWNRQPKSSAALGLPSSYMPPPDDRPVFRVPYGLSKKDRDAVTAFYTARGYRVI